MNYKSDFDLDLSTGEQGEQSLSKILSLTTVEVKTDFIACRTGNIGVEFYSRGLASGIAVTKASHWAFIIPEKGIIIIETERLKSLAREYYKKGSVKKGGDNNSSEMVLIPIKDLFNDR